MDPVPPWVLQKRRLIVLRFAVALARPKAKPSEPVCYKAELAGAGRLAFCRWLRVTYRLTEWPTTLPSETTPLSRYLERPRRRS